MNIVAKQQSKILWVLVAVLVLAGALRIIGMTWGLPYQLHPDEPVLFINAWERWDTGVTNFESQYPPLYIYMLVAQRGFISILFGDDTPQVVYFFFGRWNSVLLSLLMVALAFRLGRFVLNPQTGLALAALMAIEPISVLDQGWIIKADMLAWVLMIVTIWASVQAMRQQSWRWVASALMWATLATLAKYNMGIVFFAPIFAAVALLSKRYWLAFGIVVAVSVGSMFAVWGIAKLFWVDDIGPAFFHCSGDDWESQAEATGIDPDKVYPALPCAPFLAFQQYASPFYQSDVFWGEQQQHTLDFVWWQIRQYFDEWRLLVLLMLLLGGIASRRIPMDVVWMVAGMVLSAGFIFVMLNATHPIRQYYLLLFGLTLVLAMGLGAQRRWVMVGVLALVAVPTVLDDVRQKAEFLKPDTRVETAEFLLDYARQGDALLIEYDHVEFQQQYGGFPKPEGYFNLLKVIGVYEYDVENLAEQGIYYVVADQRGWSEDASRNHPQDFPPDNYQLLLDLTGDDYYGPARRIYRTFRPEQVTGNDFGGAIWLEGYDLVQTEDMLTIELYWHTRSAPLPEYVLFVHVIDVATGEQASGQDAQPAQSTPFWNQNEWILDTRQLSIDALPPGTYQVDIGWYHPVDGARLSVDGDPTGVLPLLTFEVDGGS